MSAGPFQADGPPTFRLLYLDPLTGWVDHYDEFEAATDDEAIDYARNAHAGRRLELWREHDRLLQLAPVGEAG